MMSDAAASDDSDLRNIVHVGTQLVSTSLAVAERTGASGQEVLTAIVVGYEASGRIAASVTPLFRAQGFHGCLGAIFGGAAASARLLGLDAAQMAQSLALSATSMGGLGTAADTSVAREYHAGLAAMLGTNATLAAQRGYLSEEAIFETEQGFCAIYGGTDSESITQNLGDSWDIVTDMAVKLMPGGHPHHALAEAAANAARAGNVSANEVEAIILSRPGVTALRGPLHPSNLIDMAHSPAYFMAAGVADHKFSWIHATEPKITDPVIHRLLDKVRVGPQPTEQIEQYRQGATVTIQTTDGRTFSSTVLVPKGAGVLGIDWADINAKYRTLMPHSQMNDQQIEASLELIHNFRDVANVSALIDGLKVH